MSFLADPAVSSEGQLGLSIRGVALLALCAGLFVVWGCWFVSTGLLVVWGCWISLYWSIGGVGLLGLSLLVYWWCGAAGCL